MAVGILALQGCIEPHERLFRRLGVETRRVRLPEDLDHVERLVLPGGESTTMLRLLERAQLSTPLIEFGRTHPLWGICAGAILIAHEVHHPSQYSLGLLDIRAIRNFYGSQLDSFKASLTVTGFDTPLNVDFIRAPLLEPLPAQDTARPSLTVLARFEQNSVLLQQGKILASSFHTELGEDTRLHELFLGL